jgi:hypothetical protein
MANRAVQLYKYIKLPDLGWRYCKAVFYPNNRIKAPEGNADHGMIRHFRR